MTHKSMLDLPAEILLAILDQVKLSCDRNHNRNTPDPLKYKDIINIAEASNDLYKVVSKWYKALEKNAGTDLLRYNLSERIEIDLDQEINWNMWIEAIKNNKNVEYIFLKNSKKKEIANDNNDRSFSGNFKELILALQDKPTLKNLRLKVRDYSVHNLHRLKHLETLYLDVEINIEDLISCLRSNQNLNVLNVRNTLLYDELSRIVPYCNNITTFKFLPGEEVDADVYIPLAKMPKLNQLRIRKKWSGSLKNFFKTLAESGSGTLSCLVVKNTMSCEEFKELANIKTLTYLNCDLSDSESFQYLQQLNKLQYLHISTSCNLNDIPIVVLDFSMKCVSFVFCVANDISVLTIEKKFGLISIVGEHEAINYDTKYDEIQFNHLKENVKNIYDLIKRM